MIDVRSEIEADWPKVHALVTAAFERRGEADLVDALRRRADPVVSLVAIDAQADDGEQLVGHILFSPVTLPDHPDLRIMGLAPMAVRPGRQRQGIGGALVVAGLDHCRALGCGAVVVLGHAAYYPRFDFVPSVRFGIGCRYEVPEDVFMAQELLPGYLSEVSGEVRFHEAFAEMEEAAAQPG